MVGAYLVCDDADGCDLVLLKDRGGHQVSCAITLCLIPLGQGLSMNLELDRQLEPQ